MMCTACQSPAQESFCLLQCVYIFRHWLLNCICVHQSSSIHYTGNFIPWHDWSSPIYWYDDLWFHCGHGNSLVQEADSWELFTVMPGSLCSINRDKRMDLYALCYLEPGYSGFTCYAMLCIRYRRSWVRIRVTPDKLLSSHLNEFLWYPNKTACKYEPSRGTRTCVIEPEYIWVW